MAVTTTSLPGGTVGTPYGATLSATGGVTPYTWSVTGGSLPPGLNLSSSGSISGTPTTAGVSSFTVEVRDGQPTTASQGLSIDVAAGGGGGGGGGGGAPGWSIVTTGTSEDLYGLDFADASNGWVVGTTQTILHTADGGTSWAPQTSGFFTATTNTQETSAHILSPPPAWGTYHLLDIHAVSSSVLWMSSAGPLQAPNPSYGPASLTAVFRSTDGGVTWTRVVMATNFQIWGIHGFSSASARAASIGSSSHTDSDIFRIDGGADQSRVAMTWDALRDIFFVDGSTGWAVGAGIFKSTNGGSSWGSQSAPGGQYWAIHFVDASNGWAVGDGGKIVHTANGGSTWSAQTSTVTSNLRGVSFADASNGWAVGDGGTILRSTDGGATWAAETSGTTKALHAVKALSPTSAWASGATGTLLRRQ